MFLTLSVSLYTSRLVFISLGVEDFGIFNVVAGVVTMFAFINSAMSSATQRFLSYEMARGSKKKLNEVFKMCVNVHFLISVLVVLLCETIGLWLLNNKLNINIERIDAANWIYQCAILGLVLTIMSVPYNANIISHEKMQAFAYISMLDVILRLILAYILGMNLGDNLEVYGTLMLFVNSTVVLSYILYNKVNFKNSRLTFYWDANLFKTLTSYTSWSLFGNLSSVASNQGVNIILNLFFGATINASRAIAYQINGAVVSFVTNLQVAINPQIIKNYSSGNKNEMLVLIFKGAKFSFFLLFIVALPVLIKTDEILKIWLGDVPEYSVMFCRLALLDALILCWSGGLMAAIQATGNIKTYQLVVGGVLLMNIPLSYLILSLYPVPYFVAFVSISLSLVAFIFRLVIIRSVLGVSILDFIKSVIIPSVTVSVILSFLFYIDIPYIMNDVIDLFFTAIISTLSSIVIIYFFGMDEDEKKIGAEWFKSLKNKWSDI